MTLGSRVEPRRSSTTTNGGPRWDQMSSSSSTTTAARHPALRCLARGRQPRGEVLVVDNGSGTGSLEAVRAGGRGRDRPDRREPRLRRRDEPGVEWALARGAATVTVLNNDTVVPPGALASLPARPLTAWPSVPRSGMRRTGGLVRRGRRRPGDGSGASPLRRGDGAVFPGERASVVETLAGCCVTASAEVWRTVGGFDERYFLIFEDADWSMRARARGVQLLVDPSVQIQHAVSASFTEDRALLGLYYYARNGLLFGSRWRRHTGRGDTRTAARFLRRHVVPEVTGAWRRRDVRGSLTRQGVLALAVADHVAGRYGRAPAWLERQAVRRARASIPR